MIQRGVEAKRVKRRTVLTKVRNKGLYSSKSHRWNYNIKVMNDLRNILLASLRTLVLSYNFASPLIASFNNLKAS